MNDSVLVTIFLAAAVASVYACCLGMLLVRGSAARLHYVGGAALLGGLLMAAAVIAEEGLSLAGRKAILVFLILAVESPILAHVIGQAVYFHQRKERT